MAKSEDICVSYNTAHGQYFERMKETGFYNTDPAVINKRIEDLGLTNVFA